MTRNGIDCKWKMPGLYPVDANDAHDELESIRMKTGRLDAENVVEESRPETAVLHPCFEWDDSVAAEKYRLQQANGIIRSIIVRQVPVGGGEKQEAIEVRAFVHIEKENYQPLKIVLADKDLKRDMMRTALRELTSFEEKYRKLELVALDPVFNAIDEVKRNAKL